MSGVVEITTKVGCPLNCRACPQKLFVSRYTGGAGMPEEGDAKARPMMMTMETFRTCVDKLPPDTQIDFSGFVEPQLNPAFVDMVLYAQASGRRVTLFSTLVGMTRESYERIREVPFVNMVLHIPDRDLNSRFVLSPEYMELAELVIRDAMTGRFHIDKYSCHGPVHPCLAEIVAQSGIYVDDNLHDRAGNVGEDGVLSLQHKGKIRCSSGPALDRNVLMPDGTVVLCGMDFGMEHVLGNLLTQDYAEIMASPVLTRLRSCMQSEKNGGCICRQCVIAENEIEHWKRLARRAVKGHR